MIIVVIVIDRRRKYGWLSIVDFECYIGCLEAFDPNFIGYTNGSQDASLSDDDIVFVDIVNDVFGSRTGHFEYFYAWDGPLFDLFGCRIHGPYGHQFSQPLDLRIQPRFFDAGDFAFHAFACIL